MDEELSDDTPSVDEPRTPEEMVARARAVARRIQERVRRALRKYGLAPPEEPNDPPPGPESTPPP